MQINGGEIQTSELTKNAMGGSELMAHRLHQSIPKELLESFQIIVSRVGTLESNKRRILWCHDLPVDNPELANKGWEKFNKIVFVSHWQKQQFIDRFQIPYSKCLVLHNAIYPIDRTKRTESDITRFCYMTTPHRGLELLYPVIDKLSESFNNIHLDVYSSFGVYGWSHRDEPYKELFELINDHSNMSYHGSVSNDEIRDVLLNQDIFAYPCIHHETSCLALIEAMSAGLVCVHSSLAALPETSANLTTMYNFHEEHNTHAGIIYKYLYDILSNKELFNSMKQKAQMSAEYSDIFYNWNNKKILWEGFLKSMLNEPIIPLQDQDVPMFKFST